MFASMITAAENSTAAFRAIHPSGTHTPTFAKGEILAATPFPFTEAPRMFGSVRKACGYRPGEKGADRL